MVNQCTGENKHVQPVMRRNKYFGSIKPCMYGQLYFAFVYLFLFINRFISTNTCSNLK